MDGALLCCVCQRAAGCLAQRIDTRMASRLSLPPLHQLFELGLCCIPNVLPVEAVRESYNAIVHTFNAIVHSIKMRGLESALKDRGVSPFSTPLSIAAVGAVPRCAMLCCVVLIE